MNHKYIKKYREEKQIPQHQKRKPVPKKYADDYLDSDDGKILHITFSNIRT